ncbi:MAG: phospho-N-acetylmuramoyl-pentapeptide-transferase [Rickettsiaceae bacterium]|nr:phospho-N-acetylmuramoyl-pentapeptide-transferase [Rickettsiaceae bacterium]
MFYNIILPHINNPHLTNLMHYISFRTALSTITSLVLCFIFGPAIIRYLSKCQKFGQPIRTDGPESHALKKGTPTMGGIMIIGSVLISTMLFANLKNPYIWISLFVMISYALLGFFDDYLKVIKNNHKGVSGKQKIAVQLIVAILACTAIQKCSAHHELLFPFFKNLTLDLGYFYIPFAMLVIIGSSNAVNLTDGLDGLAIVPIAIVSGCFAIICYLSGNHIYSTYLQIPHITDIGEITILCGAIIGGSLGFLWYNAQPAEVFMGDTGSLSLGGTIGTISVISKNEVLLSIIGGLFVIETISVILQVYYFKMTGGKRIFKMAPLHHHFEKSGWSESKVVIRFWIIALLFAVIGMASLKLR